MSFSRSGRERRPPPAGLIVTLLAVAVLFIATIAMWETGPRGTITGTAPRPVSVPVTKGGGLAASADAQAFSAWLSAADSAASASASVGPEALGVRSMALGRAPSVPTAAPNASGAASGGTAVRTAGTNVQVPGVDEPDILKTDGKRLYYSPGGIASGGPVIEPLMGAGTAPAAEGTASAGVGAATVSSNAIVAEPASPPTPVRTAPGMPIYRPPSIKVIDALPPAALKLAGTIDKAGEMLLDKGTLAVLANDGVYAYDVSGGAPKPSWSYSYGRNSGLVTARSHGDQIILVLRAGIDRAAPCPLRPLSSAGASVVVPCGAIWHPVVPTPSDATYTVVELDAATGKERGAVSYVGSWDRSVVYVSGDAVYGTWTMPLDQVAAARAFMDANPDIFPAEVRTRIDRLPSIDISDEAKQVELQVVLRNWTAGLSPDDRLKLQNDLADRAKTFLSAHLRELQRTGIVRIPLDGLTVAAHGSVPGTVLDQFSLDAYDGRLRVATTVGGTGFYWQFGGTSGDQSVNDVYVLDGGLKTVGSVTDLGKGERIYSTRFVGDKGYVVTAKQADPFYVLDLSDPAAPRLAGQLSLPGYSSYLHPVDATHVLGIGKDGNQVKVAMFDVSDPSAPKETAHYVLDESWSDVLSDHHAFLLDKDHHAFFLPGAKGGYVFRYGPASLDLVKAVSGVQARRATYINDHLYMVGDNAVVVLDENDWTRVSTLDIGGK